jgi:hypothetical protein
VDCVLGVQRFRDSTHCTGHMSVNAENIAGHVTDRHHGLLMMCKVTT